MESSNTTAPAKVEEAKDDTNSTVKVDEEKPSEANATKPRNASKDDVKVNATEADPTAETVAGNTTVSSNSTKNETGNGAPASDEGGKDYSNDDEELCK